MPDYTTYLRVQGRARRSAVIGVRPDTLPLAAIRGLYRLGGTPETGETLANVLQRSRTNLINPLGAPLTVVGNPLVEADGITCTGGSDYFNTGAAEVLQPCYIVMAKRVDGTAHAFMGNQTQITTTPMGTLLNSSTYTSGSGNIRMQAGGKDGSSAAVNIASGNHLFAGFDDWSLLLGQVVTQATAEVTAPQIQTYNLRTGASRVDLLGASTRTTADLAASTVCIGSAPVGGVTGKAKFRYAFDCIRPLTTAERAAMRDWMIADAARDGIVVPA